MVLPQQSLLVVSLDFNWMTRNKVLRKHLLKGMRETELLSFSWCPWGGTKTRTAFPDVLSSLHQTKSITQLMVDLFSDVFTGDRAPLPYCVSAKRSCTKQGSVDMTS